MVLNALCLSLIPYSIWFSNRSNDAHLPHHEGTPQFLQQNLLLIVDHPQDTTQYEPFPIKESSLPIINPEQLHDGNTSVDNQSQYTICDVQAVRVGTHHKTGTRLWKYIGAEINNFYAAKCAKYDFQKPNRMLLQKPNMDQFDPIQNRRNNRTARKWNSHRDRVEFPQLGGPFACMVDRGYIVCTAERAF